MPSDNNCYLTESKTQDSSNCNTVAVAVDISDGNRLNRIITGMVRQLNFNGEVFVGLTCRGHFPLYLDQIRY